MHFVVSTIEMKGICSELILNWDQQKKKFEYWYADEISKRHKNINTLSVEWQSIDLHCLRCLNIFLKILSLSLICSGITATLD